jgi:disulfide bond formation protein DsbB
MVNHIRKILAYIVAAAALAMGAYAAPAGAVMIGTGEAVPQQSERERVKALVARPEVAKKLQTLGVLPKDAAARVDALTDAEVATLAARIDALPAGGAFTTQEWLLIIIAILVLIIAL